MSVYRLLVPSGIGDFSWLWSKLSTTGDQYDIEYAVTGPDRLGPFLSLLPRDKIVAWRPNPKYRCSFNTHSLEMNLVPSVKKLERYKDLENDPCGLWCAEPNTWVERGNRIEGWLGLPKTDFHYRINGIIEDRTKENYFIVHLSSYKMFKIWKTYDIDQNIEIIEMIQKTTGWLPVFIGADYDDFAKECYEKYAQTHSARSLIGKTEDVISALHVIQGSRFFLGSVSSGMTMLANVLYVPSCSWWPREKLPQSWAAPDVPYKWFLWKDHQVDMATIEMFVKEL